MFTLVAAGSGAFWLVMPISLLIVTIFVIIVVSYRQTIRAYPNGGGSYIVAKENLGTGPALVAAAALLTDYVLTVSVSVAAGVLAITSAFPSLEPLRVPLGVAAILFVMLINLRGMRESGTVFAAPTYIFLVSTLGLIGLGLLQTILGSPPHVTGVTPAIVAPESLGALLLDAGLRRRLQRDHRRRGGLQRGPGLQAAGVAQCPHDPHGHGRPGGHHVPRPVVPRRRRQAPRRPITNPWCRRSGAPCSGPARSTTSSSSRRRAC